jgi:AcrR family transcriptional regulator
MFSGQSIMIVGPTPPMKERILAAAGALFAGQRFHKTRMDDIAHTAGVGKGTLYRYFRDKNVLYEALLLDASSRLLTQLDLAQHENMSPKECLVAMTDALIRFFDQEPHLFALILRSEAQALEPGDFPWQNTRQEAISRFIAILEKGSVLGTWQISDPSAAILFFLGGVRATIRWGEQPRPERLASGLVHAFLNGFGA